MRILGIDPGTALVGWAIVDEVDGSERAVAYGHISTAPSLALSRRIAEIARDIRAVVEAHQPDEASIEELFFFNNQKTVISVAQSRGGILLTLDILGIPVAEYTPLQVKQALTGYGRANKKQVQLMVQNILRLSEIPKPDDTADALALALCHHHSRKMNTSQNLTNTKTSTV